MDQLKYHNWTDEEKQRADRDEKLLVLPYPEANAICRCPTTEAAAWIAQRLNLASVLEQMTYDFATGKTDGSEIVELVRKNIEA